MMKQANPKMLLSVWYRYIYLKYADKIEEENINYFLEKDYTEDVAKMENSGSSVIESINKLKGPLKELDKENTAKCLQYLKNLNNLSNMYMNF